MSEIASSIVAVGTIVIPQNGTHDQTAIVLDDMAPVNGFRGFVVPAEYAERV